MTNKQIGRSDVGGGENLEIKSKSQVDKEGI